MTKPATGNRAQNVVYLDYQATTPTDPRALEAMLPFFTEAFGNPHSVEHAYGWDAEEAVERARAEVADLIGAEAREIVFTSGATEANNLAIKGVARFHRERAPKVLANTSGFLYYVSITGITGTRSAAVGEVRGQVDFLRGYTDLPIAVGFGIKTPEQAAEIAGVADAAVVGSALVDRVKANLDPEGRPAAGLVDDVLGFVGELAAGVRSTRR